MALKLGSPTIYMTIDGKPFECRSTNPGFLQYVRRFYAHIHQQINGLYFYQGGPVIGVQLDNEYMHSSAPWEVTTGTSNEWVPGGHDGEAYILALKKIAQEEGIIVPFYTCTAWGRAIAPDSMHDKVASPLCRAFPSLRCKKAMPFCGRLRG